MLHAPVHMSGLDLNHIIGEQQNILACHILKGWGFVLWLVIPIHTCAQGIQHFMVFRQIASFDAPHHLHTAYQNTIRSYAATA